MERKKNLPYKIIQIVHVNTPLSSRWNFVLLPLSAHWTSFTNKSVRKGKNNNFAVPGKSYFNQVVEVNVNGAMLILRTPDWMQ